MRLAPTNEYVSVTTPGASGNSYQKARRTSMESHLPVAPPEKITSSRGLPSPLPPVPAAAGTAAPVTGQQVPQQQTRPAQQVTGAAAEGPAARTARAGAASGTGTGAAQRFRLPVVPQMPCPAALKSRNRFDALGTLARNRRRWTRGRLSWGRPRRRRAPKGL